MYRFDDAYEKIYEYAEDQKAYLFIGKYHNFGIEPEMSEDEKIKAVNDIDRGEI